MLNDVALQAWRRAVSCEQSILQQVGWANTTAIGRESERPAQSDICIRNPQLVFAVVVLVVVVVLAIFLCL